MTNTAAPAARIKRTPAERAEIFAGLRARAAAKGTTAGLAPLTPADVSEMLTAGDYTVL